jgi:Zn-dependent protease with chaperone function
MLRQFLCYTGYTTIITAAYAMAQELRRKDNMSFDPSFEEASKEKVSDSSSCYGISKKLGTAHVLAYDLKLRNEEMRDELDKQRQSLAWDNPAALYKYVRRCVKLFFDVHPSTETRIQYLQPLKDTSLYKLPESQEYKDIVTKLRNKV